MRLSNVNMPSSTVFTRIDVNIKDHTEIEVNIAKLKEGNVEEIHKAIRKHVGLIINICGRYAPQAFYKTDDILSVALLALTNAANNFKNIEHDNLTGYIVASVHGKIADFLADDHLVRIPRTTLNNLLEGVADTDKDEMYERLLPQVMPAIDERSYPVQDLNNRLDIYREILSEIPLTFTETYILEEREKGYLDEEIGTRIGLTKARVGQIRVSLFERFKQKWSDFIHGK